MTTKEKKIDQKKRKWKKKKEKNAKKNILHDAGRVVQKEHQTFEFDNVYICYAWIYDVFILTLWQMYL